jgi:hypothetical protein
MWVHHWTVVFISRSQSEIVDRWGQQLDIVIKLVTHVVESFTGNKQYGLMKTYFIGQGQVSHTCRGLSLMGGTTRYEHMLVGTTAAAHTSKNKHKCGRMTPFANPDVKRGDIIQATVIWPTVVCTTQFE